MKEIGRLHYFSLRHKGDVAEVLLFKNKFVTQVVNLIYKNDKEVVFLLSILNEVYITDDVDEIESLLVQYSWFDENGNILLLDGLENVFLQEYSSFEEAYAIALQMKETNKLSKKRFIDSSLN